MKNNKGITLISLIVTIIILLILAGVSIALVSSNDGIIGRAEKAADVTKRASAREKLELELISIKAEILGERGKVSLEELDKRKEELKQKGIEVAETGTPRKVTLDGYPFKVNDDLTIEEDETSTGGTTGSGGGSQTEGSTVTKEGKIFGIDINTEGDGSESSPYIITNKEQLYTLAVLVNIGGNTFEGKNIKLNNDITLDSAKQWVPIGNNATYFKGTFDGNGKTISGIAIENSLEKQGLFGVIGQTGTVKNLTIEGSIKAADQTGGISGVNYGTISRSVNKVNVTNCKTKVYSLGGITGFNEGLVQECCNSSNISGYDCVGGIVAYNIGIVKKCYNTGTIYGSSAAIGGIVGQNGLNSRTGYIYNCYNNASVKSDELYSGIEYSGGIAGGSAYNSGKGYIYNSYSIKNTKIIGFEYDSNNVFVVNSFTTDANGKLTELNSGIDEVNGTDTEQPWIADTKNINEGYPILNWQ